MNVEVLQADYHNEKHAADLVYLLDSYARDSMGGGVPLSEETEGISRSNPRSIFFVEAPANMPI